MYLWPKLCKRALPVSRVSSNAEFVLFRLNMKLLTRSVKQRAQNITEHVHNYQSYKVINPYTKEDSIVSYEFHLDVFIE